MDKLPMEIRESIRRKAAAEWPDDFKIQKYVIDQQAESFLALEAYSRPDIPKEVITQIKQKAEMEWARDFRCGYMSSSNRSRLTNLYFESPFPPSQRTSLTASDKRPCENGPMTSRCRCTL